MNNKYTKIVKQAVEKALSFLFPFEDFNDRPSVFIQQSWIEKIMTPTQVKDYLWVPSKRF